MLPDFSVLLGLILGLMSLQPGLGTEPGRALLGTALCLLVGGAATRMAAQRGRRALDEEDPLGAVAAMRWTTLWPLFAWVAALWLFGWGSLVEDYVSRSWWVGRYLILLAPAAALFALGWAARWEVESALVTSHGGVPSTPTARAAIRAGFRRNVIAFLPLLVLTGLLDGIWVLGSWGIEPLRTAALWLDRMPLLQVSVFVGMILLAMPLLPRWIARMLGAKPMPAGPLRDRLEASAKSIGLRVGHILVWPTQHRILNAMVIGVTPRSRTIILSDRIIAELPDDELLAVFFHEAGHAKLQHLVLYLAMAFSLVALGTVVRDDFLLAGIGPGWVLFLELAIFWFVILGSVSRRFEREADVFGADHAAWQHDDDVATAPGMPGPVPRGAALMMRALDRVRIATGGRGPSHRHGTLEDRIQYIGAHATDAEVRAQFSRTRRTLRMAILGGVALAVLGVVQQWPTDLRRAQAGMSQVAGEEAVQAAEALLKQGDRDAARPHWASAYDAYVAAAARLGEDPQHPIDRVDAARWQYLAGGIALDDLGNVADARARFEQAEVLLKGLDAHGALDAASWETLQFLTWIGQARVAARSKNWDLAADYLGRAVRAERRLSTAEHTSNDMGAWYAEILAIARSAVDGHAAAAAPDHADKLRLARERLEQIVSGSRPALRWWRLRRAAQHALDALPAAPAPAAEDGEG